LHTFTNKAAQSIWAMEVQSSPLIFFARFLRATGERLVAGESLGASASRTSLRILQDDADFDWADE
jgi:hypothetical protein